MNSLTRFLLVFLIHALFFCYVPVVGQAQEKERPNFLTILLDDAGYGDFGCYGSQIETPHLDRLAAEGIRFTDCHASAPNCSPSRVGLMTGRVPARAGMYNYRPPGHPMHLRKSETTLPKLMHDAGYHTGHFGKWHLSGLLSQQPQPDDFGFDDHLATSNNALPNHHNPTNFVRNGKALGKVEGYSCQFVVEETGRWLEQHVKEKNDQPFYAHVWFHEPHNKIASPAELVRYYQNKYPKLTKKAALYYANIANVDLAVGRLLKKLDELNLSENTVIFLSSDNGPLNQFSTGGYRGKKSQLYEAGHREPGILRWPAKVKPAQTCHGTISFIDLLPTYCELAGIPLPENHQLDGISLVPLLNNSEWQRSEPLFIFFYRVSPAALLRKGDWVILADLDQPLPTTTTHWLSAPDLPLIKSTSLAHFQLYNLKNDPYQKQDLAESQPQKLEELKTLLLAKHTDVLKKSPVWKIPSDYFPRSPPLNEAP